MFLLYTVLWVRPLWFSALNTRVSNERLFRLQFDAAIANKDTQSEHAHAIHYSYIETQ